MNRVTAIASASHKRRQDPLRRQMENSRVDAFLVTHLPNVFYLCGFTGDTGALLIEDGRARLFTDGRFTIQAREEVKGARVRIISGRPLLDGVGRHLKGRRKLRVAFEGASLTVARQNQLRVASGKKVRWVQAGNWVEQLRAVKDEEELAAMQDAAQLASKVLEEVVPLAKPGVREIELAAEIEYRMRRLGASGAAFDTIVASGSRAALPHARASTKPLQRNELVVIDMGAILRHYCSDLTRTIYLGRAPTRVRRWYQAVLEAQSAARQALRPGANGSEIDGVARAVLKKAGVDRAFVHSTGHGLGLEVHEQPRLGRNQHDRLQTGNVVTIEPGVYFEGVGGIRIEDDVAVLAEGAETLTTAPRELIEL